MALRIIQDEEGRSWQVWGVQPTAVYQNAGLNPLSDEAKVALVRRQQTSVDPQWAAGWLAFETPGERRRLTPYPSNWTDLSERDLAKLCSEAYVVRPIRGR